MTGAVRHPARRELSIASRHPRLRLDRRALARALATLDAHAGKFRGGCPAGELSIAFLTDADLARLHADFLSDPTPTDVITFAGNPALGTAGEICVSADAALRHLQSGAGLRPASRSAPGASLEAELTLYVVHGWLHLAGYDDLVPARKRLMRRAEARALKLLRTADAIPRFSLRH